ncbi:extracellular catalytic domain type 1 short-chain-length polyhydroxyalkanoate depolymerase [Nocardioides bruguierae]|uniref:extracellular catalytic domain type 1 short-chain-length polyhydroxyalkanoate depolymerase n=1 Tax=Nocardioides bruguierae TaxID=2945102 RepID=UPI0020223A15|nr:PHB depolymerase family esterase [Nocardioides bruguierae]MCL8025906.1 PHB depolymerase family esterase [Nocardioides bruguierae]
MPTRSRARRTLVPAGLLAAVLTAVLAATLAAGVVGLVGPARQPAAAAGSWTQETVAGLGVRLYTPTTAPALDGRRALMVTLHGCVQTNADLATGGNWQATADAYGMVVAAPAAPDGGVLLGCWDYYDTQHSRSAPARHDDDLLALVDALLARPDLDIDPDQVYLSGLSSGGGETMVMGCLAPDVFAGIGIDAGPTVGTTSGQISYVATTQAQATSTCTGFAGSHTDAFDTQLTSVVHGSDDTTVAPGYNRLNAEVMAGIYGATDASALDTSTLTGANPAGSGTVWSDEAGPRVSLFTNTGVAHAWPAGAGPGASYVDPDSVDYPAYVTGFFFGNNRRTDATLGQTPDPTPTTSPTPTTEPTSTPTSTPTTPASCWTTTNAEHEAAGRAVSYGNDPYNPFYALGSQDYLGQGDATVTSLELTSAGRYDLVTAC